MEPVNECLEFLSVYYTRRTCKIQQNHKRIPSKYTLRCVRRIDTIEFTKNLPFLFPKRYAAMNDSLLCIKGYSHKNSFWVLLFMHIELILNGNFYCHFTIYDVCYI